ncbi:MAG: YdcF family protein [Pseudohongiellaceae bacterium]|nr:YdcF family protein [Pseudohongiellaceae bacterium]
MDTVFFWASKLVWLLISPANLLYLIIVLATGLLYSPWRNAGRKVLVSACTILGLIAIFPVGEWLIYPLESRFAATPALPENVEGIIALGGALDSVSSKAWQQTNSNESADRIHALIELAQRYPQARIVFTGGSGSLRNQSIKEAELIGPLLQTMGLDLRRLETEADSRNTWENARNSKALIQPTSAGNWILVTSAFHMPRSRGVFCANNWPTIAWPVDHRSSKDDLFRMEFKLSQHMSTLDTALREWVGLIAYRLSGKTNQLLPGTASQCSAV